MPQNLEIFFDSLEAFRSLVVESFRQEIDVGEREAAETGEAVFGEFSVDV